MVSVTLGHFSFLQKKKKKKTSFTFAKEKEKGALPLREVKFNKRKKKG